ncbi:MAG: hypothetical protein ACT4PX_07235 [Actinomycetota bacterium]
MTERYTAREVHPVMTMAGIMPGGAEMENWYNHVPFPNPAQLALKRAELLAEIERWKAEKAAVAGRPGLQAVRAEGAGGTVAGDRSAA